MSTHGVIHQHQVGESSAAGEGIQVGKFFDHVTVQDDVLEVRGAGGEGGEDLLDSVPGEEEGAEAGREGDVAEDLDVVVGEVDCIVILALGVSFSDFEVEGRERMRWMGRRKGLTAATPRFSMAGILCPAKLAQIPFNLDLGS